MGQVHCSLYIEAHTKDSFLKDGTLMYCMAIVNQTRRTQWEPKDSETANEMTDLILHLNKAVHKAFQHKNQRTFEILNVPCLADAESFEEPLKGSDMYVDMGKARETLQIRGPGKAQTTRSGGAGEPAPNPGWKFYPVAFQNDRLSATTTHSVLRDARPFGVSNRPS